MGLRLSWWLLRLRCPHLRNMAARMVGSPAMAADLRVTRDSPVTLVSRDREGFRGLPLRHEMVDLPDPVLGESPRRRTQDSEALTGGVGSRPTALRIAPASAVVPAAGIVIETAGVDYELDRSAMDIRDGWGTHIPT